MQFRTMRSIGVRMVLGTNREGCLEACSGWGGTHDPVRRAHWFDRGWRSDEPPTLPSATLGCYIQLALPSEETGKTKAWLLLEQGDLAGKRYELTASICSNPVCECGIVSLRCAPVAGESQPRSSSAMVGYHEILPYAAPLEVSLNLRSWLFDDQYCVRPKCPCQAATITFHPLPTRNEAERSRQLNCRKPPLAFRCVITTTAAMSKYFQIRVTRRRLDGN